MIRKVVLMANSYRVSERGLWIAALALCLVLSPLFSAHGSSVPSFSYVENAGDWLGENIANAGDINNDGIDDIILRHQVTGLVYGWLMNGTTIAAQGTIYDGLPEGAALPGDLRGTYTAALPVVVFK